MLVRIPSRRPIGKKVCARVCAVYIYIYIYGVSRLVCASNVRQQHASTICIGMGSSQIFLCSCEFQMVFQYVFDSHKLFCSLKVFNAITTELNYFSMQFSEFNKLALQLGTRRPFLL